MKNFLVLFLITLSFQIKILEAQVADKSSNVESVKDTGQFPGRKSTWKGFVRYDFDFRGRACRIVCPDKPAKGNP
jgi:hypothetical protein